MLQKSQLSNFKKIDAVSALRISRTIYDKIYGAFLTTFTQLEKTGSTGKVFIPLESKKINSTFEPEIVHVFCAISTFVFVEWYLGHFQQTNFN